MDRRQISKVITTQPDNQKLSLSFIQLLKAHFEHKPNKQLQMEVEKFLTSGSGFSAFNLQLGYEVVSAASMFHVLRLINSPALTNQFLELPVVLGQPRRKSKASPPPPVKTSYTNFED